MRVTKSFPLIAIVLLFILTIDPNLGYGEIAQQQEKQNESEQIETSHEGKEIADDEKENTGKQNLPSEKIVEESLNEAAVDETLKEDKTLDEKKENKKTEVNELKTKEPPKQEILSDKQDSQLSTLNSPGHYATDPGNFVLRLENVSTNDHTRAALLWTKNGTVYVAVKATHPLDLMELNGTPNTGNDIYEKGVKIVVNGEEYDPKEGLSGNTQDAHWTVFSLPITTLQADESGKHHIFVRSARGRGHDVGDQYTYTLPTKEITAKKKWINSPSSERPTVTLQLIGKVANDEQILRLGEVDGSEILAWHYTWKNIPKYDSYGRAYTFSVDEETVPVNYTKQIDGFTVLNTYDPETIDIDVSKTWIGPKKNKATFILYRNGERTDKKLTLQSNKWTGVFSNLNKFSDDTGAEIEYDVKEESIPGYTTEKSGSVVEGFHFTNINDTTIDLSVKKKWIGPTKSAVTIYLYKDYESTPADQLTLSENMNWQGEFKNLRKYDSTTGKKINYIVKESPINDYSANITGSMSKGFIITNTNNETINIPVEKRWIGEEEDEVTIHLIANGVKTGQSLTLNKTKNWQGTFKNVRKFDSIQGGEIEYTVEEEVNEQYEVTIEELDGKFIVTNRAKYGSIQIDKVDEEGKALPDAAFTITGPNGFEETKTSDQDGTILFEDLAWGTYKVKETKAPSGYRLSSNEREIHISVEDLHHSIEIANEKIDWEIPNTGGIGTISLFTIGLLFMVGASVFYFRRFQM